MPKHYSAGFNTAKYYDANNKYVDTKLHRISIPKSSTVNYTLYLRLQLENFTWALCLIIFPNVYNSTRGSDQQEGTSHYPHVCYVNVIQYMHSWWWGGQSRIPHSRQTR